MKKLICIITIFIMLFTMAGCSSEIENMHFEDIPNDYMYLVGDYSCLWDATETFARIYYELGEDKEFILPTHRLLINTLLTINENGSGILLTNDDQIQFAFDTFLSESNLKEIELLNICGNDIEHYDSYINQRNISYDEIIYQMKMEYIDQVKLNFAAPIIIKKDKITFADSPVIVEYQDGTVKLTITEEVTNTTFNFIKKAAE